MSPPYLMTTESWRPLSLEIQCLEEIWEEVEKSSEARISRAPKFRNLEGLLVQYFFGLMFRKITEY
jgi:hypothetical protein